MKTNISQSYIALTKACHEKGFEVTYSNNLFWVVDRNNGIFTSGTFEEVFEWVESYDDDSEIEIYVDSFLPEFNGIATLFSFIAIIFLAISLHFNHLAFGFLAVPFVISACYLILRNKNNKDKNKNEH